MDKFAEECARKESLMNLFEALEKNELAVKSKLKEPKKKYERIFRGWAKVTKITPTSLHLKRESGGTIRPLMINQEIAALINLNDGLMLTAGLRDRQWYVIFMSAIGSHLSEDPQLQFPIAELAANTFH
jgi:hypothetical protein